MGNDGNTALSFRPPREYSDRWLSIIRVDYLGSGLVAIWERDFSSPLFSDGLFAFDDPRTIPILLHGYNTIAIDRDQIQCLDYQSLRHFRFKRRQCVTSTTSKLAGRSGVQWTAITDGIGDIVRYFCVFDPDVQLTSKHTGCQQHTRCNHSQYCTGGEHGAGFSALEFGSFQRTGSYHFWCGYLFSGTNDYHTI